MTGETILVIDTDTESTQIIVSTLESKDFLVFTAPSGDVGVTMAKKVNPSLIFVNPAMSGASGLEVCKTIHNTQSLKDVPIVILSAFEGAMDPRYTTMYGIVDSLRKPFSPEELVSKTKNVLSSKFSRASVPEVEEMDSSFAESAEVETGEEMRVQRNGDFAEPDISEKTVAKTKKEMESEKTQRKAKPEINAVDKTIVKSRQEIDVESAAVTAETNMDSSRIVEQSEFEDEEKTDMQLSGSEPEEAAGERETAYVPRRDFRRRNMGNRLVVPVIIVVIIAALGGAGFYLYTKDMLPISIPWIGKKAPAKVAAKPLQPSVTAKPQGQQKPVETRPVAQAPTQSPTPASAISSTAPVASAPAPAPKASAPKPAGKEVYSVQAGAFKSENNASTLTKQLKDKGYDAFTFKAQKKGETIYRVLIGKFENRKEASKLASKIRAEEKMPVTITKE